jgi:hypothetical protein
MKNKIVYTLFISCLFFAASTPLYAAANSYADNEQGNVQTNEQHVWQGISQEPETSSIGANPGIPEAPIDSNLYILFIGSLIYGFVLFRKEKRLKL